MRTRITSIFIQFCVYLTASFAGATLGYFIIKAIRSGKPVFGSAYRMLPYHQQHPFSYILIPCAVYGLITAIGGSQPAYKSVSRQILLTLAIVFFTLLFSFPLGGILYYYHDMRAGFFPENWLPVLVVDGASAGFENGWKVIALSFPYNLLGIVVCYYITKWGSNIFYKNQPEPAV